MNSINSHRAGNYAGKSVLNFVGPVLFSVAMLGGMAPSDIVQVLTKTIPQANCVSYSLPCNINPVSNDSSASGHITVATVNSPASGDFATVGFDGYARNGLHGLDQVDVDSRIHSAADLQIFAESPEPSNWLMLGTGVVGLVGLAHAGVRRATKELSIIYGS